MRPLASLFRKSPSSTTMAEGPRAVTPRWAKWTLLGLLSASAALYSWNLDTSGFSDYYATAAKSMSLSWRAFFFGAFDPNATITLDKLSGFLVPQALSIKMFGYAPWALALPQVIEGLITIAAVFWVANRWLGPVGGLVSAFLVAYTPLLISIFSHPMEDALLTMFTALSVVAWQRALETGRTRWLMLAGVLVGLGFQAKMMQSWLVLPAFVLVYFLASPQSRARKAFGFSIAAVVTLAVLDIVDGDLQCRSGILTSVRGRHHEQQHFLDGFRLQRFSITSSLALPPARSSQTALPSQQEVRQHLSSSESSRIHPSSCSSPSTRHRWGGCTRWPSRGLFLV